MIVKDGWFAMQRFLKPDISEDISNNRSRLSKAPSLSIVFSILNIAKHCLHVWFASPYLLSHIPSCATCKPWTTSLRRTTARYILDWLYCTVLYCTVLYCTVLLGGVPRPHGPLLQAGPGSARPAGHLGSVHLIYLLLSIYTILYYTTYTINYCLQLPPRTWTYHQLADMTSDLAINYENIFHISLLFYVLYQVSPVKSCNVPNSRYVQCLECLCVLFCGNKLQEG